VQDGLPLGGIQVREVALGRGDGHPLDASGGGGGTACAPARAAPGP
jgi:hypothetical protein